jgi:DNA polymerase III epsilon subunit-like protein
MLQAMSSFHLTRNYDRDVKKKTMLDLLNMSKVDYAVLDTETSGLSRNDVVVQFAIGLYDASGLLLDHYNRLWKLPAGISMNKMAQRVHNISPTVLEQEGWDSRRELHLVHDILHRLSLHNKTVVAHNAAFDTRLLNQTAAVQAIEEWDIPTPLFCTMSSARQHILGPNGTKKSPSNVECYRHFFGCDPDLGPLHDAMT